VLSESTKAVTDSAGCGEAHSLFGVVAVSIMDGWVDASIIFLQHTAGALVRLVV